MASENYKDQKHLMSEELKRITNKMIFEGVTPKSDMKKVKAMKKLWRSDSFQVLKAILEEPPILEGRVRPTTIALKDDDDEIPETEASPRDTPLEKETKEKEIEFCKKKEELTILYQNCLEEDLNLLQEKANDINEALYKKALGEVEDTEVEQLEDAAKQKIIGMMKNIKCFKKNQNNMMKLAKEEDRKIVTEELNDYINREIEVRSRVYKQLLQKIYDYKMRMLEETLFEEHEDKIRQRLRMATNKFEFAKNRLLKRQAKELESLNCRLMAEYTDFEKQSENRVQSMLEDAINKVDVDVDQGPDEVASEESECSLITRAVSEIQYKLPWKPSNEENWENIVEELLKRYQFFVELVFRDKQMKQHEYLLSIGRLKSFKDKIAQITHQKITETSQIRKRRKLRFEAKLKAASIMNNLIRDVLPSPLPSRYSISDLHFGTKVICRMHRKTTVILDGARLTMKSIPDEQTKPYERISQHLSHSRNDTSELKTEMYTEEIRKSLVDTFCDNPQLFNVFFSGV